MTWNAPTTAPAGSRSMVSRPPDMASTRSTYCCAKSIQMSPDGHDVCILTTSGLCPSTAGAARPLAATPPAKALPLRNERRETDLSFLSVMSSSLLPLRPLRTQQSPDTNQQVLTLQSDYFGRGDSAPFAPSAVPSGRAQASDREYW